MNRSKKIRTLAALGSLSGAAWAGTFASFTDEGTATADFTAGTVTITPDAAAFTDLAVGNLKPSDVRYAPLVVKNDGSLDFSYVMTGAALDTDGTPPGLGDALQVEVRSMSTTCSAATFSASTDEVVSSRALRSISAGTRALAPGDSETLCFQITFPDGEPAEDNLLQGSATTATFTFNATQSG